MNRQNIFKTQNSSFVKNQILLSRKQFNLRRKMTMRRIQIMSSTRMTLSIIRRSLRKSEHEIEI